MTKGSSFVPSATHTALSANQRVPVVASGTYAARTWPGSAATCRSSWSGVAKDWVAFLPFSHSSLRAGAGAAVSALA